MTVSTNRPNDTQQRTAISHGLNGSNAKLLISDALINALRSHIVPATPHLSLAPNINILIFVPHGRIDFDFKAFSSRPVYYNQRHM